MPVALHNGAEVGYFASMSVPAAVSNQKSSLLHSSFWAIGTYGASQALRLGSNVAMSRLLSPDILGIMVIVNTIRVGVELLTDVGIEQNIVSHKRGLEPNFFNTCWTLQIIRGAMLSVIFLAIASPLASFYHVDRSVLLVMSAAPLINALHSTGVFALVKTMKVRARNVFELSCESASFAVTLVLAILLRNVWALVIGSLAGLGIRSLLSYRIAHPPHRLQIDRAALGEIMNFGKWIVISSFVAYAANNLDRIFLGKSVALGALGIFGLAKVVSDMPGILANRLSYQIVFPATAAARAEADAAVSSSLAAVRWKFVLAAALGMAAAAACADVGIGILYDHRYHAASWMLFLLLGGSWFAVLSNLNEATLLASGKPAYNSMSNVIRLGLLAVALPIGFKWAGLLGAIAALSLGELSRFVFVTACQRRAEISYARQDLVATLVFFALTAGLCLCRLWLGLGTPWGGITLLAFGQ